MATSETGFPQSTQDESAIRSISFDSRLVIPPIGGTNVVLDVFRFPATVARVDGIVVGWVVATLPA